MMYLLIMFNIFNLLTLCKTHMYISQYKQQNVDKKLIKFIDMVQKYILLKFINIKLYR